MRRIRATLKGIVKIIREIIEKTISWFGSVTLELPINNGLEEVNLHGGTKQDNTDKIVSVILSGQTEQRNVPEGYTELDYLKNVMNSTKFNTWLKPQNWDVLELVRTAWSPGVSNYMFQSREWTTAWIYGISWSSSWWTIMWNRWSGQSLVSEILRTNGHKYYTKMSVVWTTLTFTVKDLTDKTENTKTREIEDTAWWPSNYFLRWNATSAQAIWTAQNVYFASITTNGVERIKLIPAKQWDTVWFYDMVSKTFMSTFVGDTPVASSSEASAHPFAPMNIVGNNWAIKVHKNLIDKSTVVRWDISVANWDINSVTYRAVSDFIPILNWQTYTLSWTLYQRWQEAPKKPNCIYALYDSNKAYITWSRVTSTNTFTIDNANASYIRVERYPTWTDELIMENSEFQFQVWAYKTAYESETWAYIEWVTETVQDAQWNEATADFLMWLSSYKDTQEVLTWSITKNTTYKVLNWTEARYVNGDIPFFRLWSAVPNGVWTSSDTLKCTHFPYSWIWWTNENQWIRVYNNALFVRYDSLAPATADWLVAFKKFLSDQYAQWTPMIVACWLSVSQTSSVAWQELIEAPVTQTAWSISNMTITVTSDWWVPSPTSPKDIICNNGIIKVTHWKNLFNKNTTPVLNIAIVNWKYVSNSARYWVAVEVKPSTTYTFSFTQSTTRVFINVWLSDNYPTVGGNCNYYWAWQIDSYTFTTSSTQKYAYFYTTNTWFINTMQVEEWSTATEYEEYKNVPYTDWTIETVEDEAWNTATAEMLLKIWDYVDSQEVLSGDITRKVWVKIFDWTEELEEAISTGGRYRYTFAIPYLPAWIVYSTHFKWWKTISELNADSTITQAVTSYSNKIYIYTATYSTLSDFKSFLATQYANWTPVIVIYPLATATTETVEWQTLTSVEWATNEIEITQAWMNPTELEMDVKYLWYVE